VPSFNNFIQYAVMRECAAVMDRYHSLMRDASEERTRKVFAIMAGRKNRALRRISRLDDKAPPIGKHATVFTGCMVPPGRTNETLDPRANALLTARAIEFEGYCRYISLAHHSRDEGRKRFFLYMVNLHKAELLFLEKLLRRTGEPSMQYV
jgi:hypothetical protein